MKILLLADFMHSGGAETHVEQLAYALQREGHLVLLWSSGGDVADRMAKSGILTVQVGPPTHNPLILLLRQLKLRRLVKKEQIHVLHAHTRLTALLLRTGNRHCAKVVTAHARFAVSPWLSRVCYWGEACIAVSRDLFEGLRSDYGLPARKITVIPNGVDLARFTPPDSPPSPTRILFASRLDGDCSLGAELLCELAPILHTEYPTVELAIAGGGDQYARLCKQAEAINASLGGSVIQLCGQLDDMPAFLRTGSIFVGVSRAALEAAVCGCAVILCGNEGYLGVWDENTHALAKMSNFCARGEVPPTAKALCKDLTHLLEHKDYRTASAAFARAYVQSCGSTVKDTLAVYRSALPSPKGLRLAIGGYFGCGNLGDDAILLGLLHALNSKHPQIAPILLSGDPRRHRREGLCAVGRRSPLGVLWALAHCDGFALGGGSLLQNRTGRLSLAYYLWLLRLAQWLGKSPCLPAAGIGPLLGDGARKRTVAVLNRCRHVGLRDESSLWYLREAGVDGARLSLGADAAFLLPTPPQEETLFWLYRLKLSKDSRLIGVILRGGRYTAYSRALLLCALRVLCRQQGLRPLLLVLDSRHDGLAARQAYAALLEFSPLLPSLQEPTDVMALLRACRCAVSMRLHGMILATTVGVPALGLSADAEDSKIPAFAKATGQPCLSSDSACVADIVQAVTKLQNADASVLLESTALEMRKKAEKDLAKLCQIVYNKGKKSSTAKGASRAVRERTPL